LLYTLAEWLGTGRATTEEFKTIFSQEMKKHSTVVWVKKNQETKDLLMTTEELKELLGSFIHE
jgi:hypothetical protein